MFPQASAEQPLVRVRSSVDDDKLDRILDEIRQCGSRILAIRNSDRTFKLAELAILSEADVALTSATRALHQLMGYVEYRMRYSEGTPPRPSAPKPGRKTK